jgi:hypothetical protein
LRKTGENEYVLTNARVFFQLLKIFEGQPGGSDSRRNRGTTAEPRSDAASNPEAYLMS